MLEEKCVSAAAAVAVVGPAAAAAAPVEEQTEFTVMLTEAGTNKIGVIKVVREVTALGSRKPRPGGQRAQAREGSREKGRGRRDEEEVRGRWRQGELK